MLANLAFPHRGGGPPAHDGVNHARKLQALPPHAVNHTKLSLNQDVKHPAFETSLASEVYTMAMDDVGEAPTASSKSVRAVQRLLTDVAVNAPAVPPTFRRWR